MISLDDMRRAIREGGTILWKDQYKVIHLIRQEIELPSEDDWTASNQAEMQTPDDTTQIDNITSNLASVSLMATNAMQRANSANHEISQIKANQSDVTQLASVQALLSSYNNQLTTMADNTALKQDQLQFAAPLHEDGSTVYFDDSGLPQISDIQSLQAQISDVSVIAQEANTRTLQKGDTGVQGIKGDTGNQGIKGDSGLQGLKGDQGIQGLKGDKGDTGLQGTQGIQGLKGDVGATGAKGDQGIQGVKGDIGIQGLKGDQGIQGIQGIKGDTGAKGDQGIQGLKGDTGLQGIQGIQGLQGVKGDTGDAGTPGTVFDVNRISVLETKVSNLESKFMSFGSTDVTLSALAINGSQDVTITFVQTMPNTNYDYKKPLITNLTGITLGNMTTTFKSKTTTSITFTFKNVGLSLLTGTFTVFVVVQEL